MPSQWSRMLQLGVQYHRHLRMGRGFECGPRTEVICVIVGSGLLYSTVQVDSCRNPGSLRSRKLGCIAAVGLESRMS